jgi:uncharacterized membrane protein YdbT with pleckstrin-like domain
MTMNEIIDERKYPIRKLWILKSVLRTVSSLFSLIIFLYIIDYLGKESFPPFFIAVFILFALLQPIYYFLKRKFFHYTIDEKFLNLKQGILSKQERHIPYGVIQNVFVKQDLFDRFFGLASLLVENAAQGAGIDPIERGDLGMTLANLSRKNRENIETVGFSKNRVSILGLSKENAEILKNIVLQKMKDNPIDDNQSGL